MSEIKLSIIFPCYNEAENIENIISRVESLLQECDDDVEIILVDNGSTDSTNEVLQTKIQDSILPNLKSIKIENNVGYGFGIMEGVRAATGEVIAWTHADLQTDPKDVTEAFKEYSKNSNYPKCILKGKRIGRNLFDTLFTAGMSFLSTLLLRKRLSDVNAQPKMFHRSFLKKLSDPPKDFSLDLYLLFQARAHNYPILEYPVHFGKRLHGEAKGGGTLRGKLKLIRRTWGYMVDLKRNLDI